MCFSVGQYIHVVQKRQKIFLCTFFSFLNSAIMLKLLLFMMRSIHKVEGNLKNAIMGKFYITLITWITCFLIVDNGMAQECDLGVSSEVQHPSCGILNDGSVSLSVTGGTKPYSYHWSSGSRVSVLQGISEGIYTVLIKDANGCQLEKEFTLRNRQLFELGLKIIHPTSQQATDGQIQIKVIGGEKPYQFQVSHYSEQHIKNNATTSDYHLKDLSVGRYIIDAVDAKGCITTGTVVLSNQN